MSVGTFQQEERADMFRRIAFFAAIAALALMWSITPAMAQDGGDAIQNPVPPVDSGQQIVA